MVTFFGHCQQPNPNGEKVKSSSGFGTMRPTEDDVTSVIKDVIDEIVDLLVGVTESDDGD